MIKVQVFCREADAPTKEVWVTELEMPVAPGIGEELLVSRSLEIEIYKVERVRHLTAAGTYQGVMVKAVRVDSES